MARKAAKLLSVSLDGPDPTIEFSDDDWRVMEEASGHKLGVERRTELTEICNWHLARQQAENKAEPQKWVIERAKKAIKKVGKAYEFLVEDLGHSGGDAHGEFSWQLKEFLHDARIINFPDDTLVRWNDSDDTGNWEPVPRDPYVAIRPTEDLACAVIDQLLSALNKIARGEGMRGSGFEDGEAYKFFLLKLRQWAKSHDWKITPFLGRGAAAGTEAGPLPGLIYELTRRFPKELRTDVQSKSAAAERLREVVAESNKIKKAMADRGE